MVDIVIIGGGIAGLWTLARLRNTGYQAILLEADSLGCKQSGASQGIIHGGTKYALTGKLTHSAQSIQKMPQRWQTCLSGVGEIDLSQAKKLSEHQYLWSNKSISSKLTGFFASKVMTSRMQHLSRDAYVSPFNRAEFKGELYQLDEPVLDNQSVIETLRVQYSEFIFHFPVTQIERHSGSNPDYYTVSSPEHNMLAQSVILTAGEGNEKLLSYLKVKQPVMQRRPLLMPMLKADKSILPPMYAHCLAASALPKITISSYTLADGSSVWYLGGEIAEKGVGRSIAEQAKAASHELQKLMPWMDFSQCQWSALAIDRAEPQMADGSRPVEPAVFMHQQVITAWPVKLAMTPIMVDQIMAKIDSLKIKKNDQPLAIDNIIPLISKAKTSPPPWEKVVNWL